MSAIARVALARPVPDPHSHSIGVPSQAADVAMVAELPAAALGLRELVAEVLSSESWEHSPCVGELQRCVRSFAAVMRDRGVLPERMIIGLKSVVGRRDRNDDRSDALHYRLVRWSVREYFRYAGD